MHIKQHTLSGRSLWRQLLSLGAILLLVGCAQLPSPSVDQTVAQLPDDVDLESIEVAPEPIPEPQETSKPSQLYEWHGDGRRISRVVIDTNAQRARFYDGEEQVGWTRVATGVSSHPTPRGEFEIMGKTARKRSNLYGRIYDANGNLHKRNADSRRDSVPAGGKFVGSRMPYFMRMTYDGIGIHAGAIPQPGQPASHGCIRLPDEVASSLFAHTNIGTRVTVIGDGPDYGNYAERIRQQREQERRERAAQAQAEAQAQAQAQAESRPESEARSPSQSSESEPEPESESEPESDTRAEPPSEDREDDSSAESQPESPSESQPESPRADAPASGEDQQQPSGTGTDPADAPEPDTSET